MNQRIFFRPTFRKLVTWYFIDRIQVTRYLGYISAILLTFLILTAIKFLLPHPEPKKQVDVIGMALYKPIFFGTSADISEEKITIDPETYVIDELPPSKEKTTEKQALPKVDEAKKTTGIGLEDDLAYFEQFLLDYKTNVQSKRKYRNDVVVRYYRHKSDSTRADVLVGYGFYLHIRPTATQDQFDQYDTNIIYYGKDFPERDIKLIAYLLIQNNIRIKEIRPFKAADGWKHNSIEIGANVKIKNKPELTLSQIRKFRKTL